MSRRFLIFLLIWFSLLTAHLSAGNYVFSTKLQGSSQIVSNASLTTEDDQYSDMSSSGAPGIAWHASNFNQSIKNYIHLKYTGAATIHYTSSWTIHVDLKIERWNENGIQLPDQYSSLDLNYNPASGTKYKDISTFSTINGAKVKVTVTGITTSGFGSLPFPADVQIENVIQVERTHKMNAAAAIYIGNTNNYCLYNGNATNGNSSNTIEFHWDYLEGAEEYDFEWVFKSDDDLNQIIDFANATRITTTNQYYTINNAFDNGKIYYRVRGIAKDFATGIKRLEGRWAQGTSGIQVCNIEKRNWTYNAVYAEEGKRKEVMTYFDGSTRNRQSVTLSNSENTGLVAEDIYDYEGRPAVKTLPAPSADLKNDLKFYQNFSLNGNNIPQPYTKKDFDDDAVTACGNSSSPGLNSTSAANGASDYYSPNNNVLYGFNGAIPDATDYLMSTPANAKSFPFTQTVYSNDGTVKMQSGPGPDFKIGSGHETKYLNATASQEKLDRLFGNEVGYAEHYREKAVIDPNGQISVSYENLSGKVIATAMRGLKPTNLLELGTATPPEEKYMAPEIIHEHFEGNYDPASESYTTLKNFAVTDISTPYDFKYEIEPQEFIKICSQHFKCKYILEITIKDDCGNSVSETSGYLSPSCSTCVMPVLNTLQPIDAANFTGTSFQATYSVMFPHTGVYRIEKRLSLDPSALQTALSNYEKDLRDPAKGCITTLNQFITSYAQGIDQTECMSCEDAAHFEVEHYVATDQNPIPYPYHFDDTHTFANALEYLNYLISQCTPQIPKKSCDGLLAALKADMSPGGQYFDNEIPANTTFGIQGGSTFSIGSNDINYINALLNANTHINPQLFDPPYNFYPSFVSYAATHNCPALPSVQPVDLHDWLSNNWHDCYADFLVQYHPEYCRWERCVDLSPSYDYDAQLLSMSYDQAINTPPNTNNTPYLTTPIGPSILVNDPYFKTISLGDAPGMSDEITNCPSCVTQFPINSNGPFPNPPLSNSMWDWAAIAPQAITPGDNQAQWVNFQKLYIAIKSQKFVKYFGCPALQDNTYPPDNIPDLNNLLAYLSTTETQGNSGIIKTLQETCANDPNGPGCPTINDPEPLNNFQDVLDNINTAIAANPNNPDFSPYNSVPCLTATATLTVASTDVNNPFLTFIQCWSDFPNPPTNLIISAEINSIVSPISTAITAPIYPWNAIWTQTQKEDFMFQAINNAINAYPGGADDFTSTLTTVSGVNTLTIWASSSLAQSASSITISLTGTCSGSDSRPIKFIKTDCGETPGYAPNCLCIELQQGFDLYNQDNGGYATFEGFAAHNLSADLGINITAANILYWRNKCNDNNNLSPYELDANGSVVAPSPDPNAIPEQLSCNPEEPCGQQGVDEANFYANEAFENLVYQQLQNFTIQYKQSCLNSTNLHELFGVDYYEREYHYTLYYYDQAGNLVRTVPPNAVNRLTPTQMYSGTNNDNNVQLARLNNGLSPNVYIYPNHCRSLQGSNSTANLLVTNYSYNTLNQLMQQETPDGGLSNFCYNDIGQMRFSENAKQSVNGKFSYTNYDGQGRIIEVGENDIATSLFQGTANNSLQANNRFYPVNFGTQVTKTYYDAPFLGYNGPSQDFLRKRVASTTYEDIEDNDDWTYNSATHYSYDIHGNVNTLVQDFPDLAVNNNQYKTINYKYDLISGNVNEVNYQAGQYDQYYHRYEYDANNRITNVYTSNDKIHWQQDARYFYYLHGPLARVEIGEEKVQGLDYAYTLQGWVKAVNSNTLKGDIIGSDGFASAYIPGQANIHGNIARDAFGYSLGYYTNDYRSIKQNIAGVITGNIGNSSIYASTFNLYNGNIKEMSTAMYQPDIAGGGLPFEMPTMARFFKYDQLNRIKEAQSLTTSSDNLNTLTASIQADLSDYYESFNFDANGNILKVKRNGYTRPGSFDNKMDDMTYNYISSSENNKLQNVADIGDNSTPANFDDIKDQSAQHPNNYHYDPIGNLTQDEAEGISNIDWSVYGKIQKIYKSDENIEFKYNASGNRIEKIVKPKIFLNGWSAEKTQETWIYTYYMRDAQGNTMATYSRNMDIVNGTSVQDALYLKETDVYGSSRLGIEEQNDRISATPRVHFTFGGYNSDGTFIVAEHPGIIPLPTLTTLDHSLGNKRYELSNHLGNVNVVISDRKLSVDLINNKTGAPTPDNVVDYYLADVLSAQDYYSFGSLMPGRVFNPGEYPNGYNGQRSTDEIAGVGNHYTAEFWEYDPRARLRWNRDPVVSPSESPYVINHNNPIQYSDPKGDKPEEGDGGDCVTCPKPKAEENPAGKDNLAGYGKAPIIPAAAPASSQTFVGPNNDTPLVQQMKSDNASSLANGGTGLGFAEQVFYGATTGNVMLNTLNSLPATVTLPLMPFTGGTSTLAEAGAAEAGGYFAASANVANKTFYTGGQLARSEAMAFSKASGYQIIDNTTVGQGLTWLTNKTSYAFTKPLWKAASSAYASGTKNAQIFINLSESNSGSIFFTRELPKLEGAGANINFKVVNPAKK